jgi:A/G-specific adenine glycosylase
MNTSEQSPLSDNISNEQRKLFARLLLRWNAEENKRQMPWKGEKDPYKIWLSEIILQQTRVEQGLKYYQNFIKAYPAIEDLAKAPQDEVFKLWEGLGYYSRCRNLIATAHSITNEKGGRFPDTYDEILQLKGVGPYTAAAIASFAFNLPHAVLDGNVFRVLSRIYSIETPIDSTEGKKLFAGLAQATLDKKRPGAYNQAIMDFGATLCKPQPACHICFFKKHCLAFREGRQNELPVKEKQLTIKERWFHYFIIEQNGRMAVEQRKAKDVWQDLYQFPLVEAAQPLEISEVAKAFQKKYKTLAKPVLKPAGAGTQRLTHQLIQFFFFHAHFEETEPIADIEWLTQSQLQTKALPKTLQQILQQPRLF